MPDNSIVWEGILSVELTSAGVASTGPMGLMIVPSAESPRVTVYCCAPVERCGTAQDGLGDDGSQTVKIKLHNTHQVHQI